MFLDASAIVAMLTEEEDGDIIARRLAGCSVRYTSAIAIFETVAAVARKNSFSVDEARAIVARFLSLAEVTLVPVDEPVAQAALSAFERYGKGRHPASLNMGDCFAYGCAKALAVPLLFKGDDFTRTDIDAA
ncbi:type II toxin-antitoxin system VapC family toxin [soil metagenome]